MTHFGCCSASFEVVSLVMGRSVGGVWRGKISSCEAGVRVLHQMHNFGKSVWRVARRGGYVPTHNQTVEGLDSLSWLGQWRKPWIT